MAAAEAQMTRVLARARRRQGGILVATALGWSLAAALAVLLAAALLLGRDPALPLRQATLALTTGILIVAAFLLARAVLRRAGSPESVARALGDAMPALRSDLVSAVQLSGERAEIAASGRYSLPLVDAHVAHAAARAEAVDLEQAFPATPARRAAVALGVVVLAYVLGFGLRGRELEAGFARLSSGGAATGATAARRAEPITGDLEITYRYPAYMNREPRTVSGTSGEIRAPLGTEVDIHTRADREVQAARMVLKVERREPAGSDAGKGAPAQPKDAGAPPAQQPQASPEIVTLAVENARDLRGRFLVTGSGTYTFQFTRGPEVIAEGPPTQIAVEEDGAPQVRITAPDKEIEVEPGARVSITWTASDDVGLGALTLVTKRAGGVEERKPLGDLGGLKRDGGAYVLDLAAMRLAPGERLAYLLEVLDNDAVSGPKRGASEMHVLKVFSAAEHRRLAFERARQLWEGLVRHLGDRLELNGTARAQWDRPRIDRARSLDAATRKLHEQFRAGAQELRRDRAAPRQLATALSNIAAGIATRERSVSQLRESLAAMLAFQQADSPLAQRVDELDDRLVVELERSTLYLDRLLDQERANDLVRLAQELEKERRDLAGMLERYRDNPTDEGKAELLAKMERVRSRMDELMKRMSESARGLGDDEMRDEAVAQASRGDELTRQLSQAQQAVGQEDVEQAMRELEAMASAMDEMKQGLQRTARRPSEAQRELVERMREFQNQLSDVESAQQSLAVETGKVKARYREEVSRRLQQAEAEAKRLEALANDALRHVERAVQGITPRSESDYMQARDRLSTLSRALAARDLDAALETARQATPSVERFAGGLEEDVAIMERYPQSAPTNPDALRSARRSAAQAVDPTREVQRALEKVFPDPSSVLGAESQAQLRQQSQQQEQLAQRAEELRQRLGDLSQRAPIFPPEAAGELGSSREHMRAASGELSRSDPMRGNGEQRQALDALRRFREGMEKNAQQGGGGEGEEFPYPMASSQSDGGTEEGDGLQAANEKVEIPSAESFKPPEEFRRELLDAMRQGAPEPYRSELQRYYQELVR